MEPLLIDERDRRRWAWLCQQVGEPRARAAMLALAGQRKAYVTNIAKTLGLVFPDDSQLPRIGADKVAAAGLAAAARAKLVVLRAEYAAKAKTA